MNARKPLYPPAERVGYIRTLYAEEPKISVESYTDLTIDLARREALVLSCAACAA